ncbi:MAG TPA: CopG family transcriptional regulator [Phycisphaerae bacterium]|nr:CopG family transcriptional regulator [Phycisphaerae bacterium]
MVMTVKLSPGTSARLAAEAKTRRISKSEVVREALEKHFNSKGRKVSPTFGQLTRDLLGSVKGGPKDVSHNPKHMERYGE